MTLLVRLLLLLWCVLPIVGARAGLPALDPDDALLLDVRAEGLRLGDGVRGYRIGEGACVDLGDFSRAVDLALTIDKARGIAEGWAFAESNLVRIDRTSARATVNGRSQPIADGAIRDADGGWCVATDVIAGWFGLRLDLDMLESTVTVGSDTALPAVSAAARAERARNQAEVVTLTRGAVQGPPVETVRLPYRAWRTPSIDASAALTMAGRRVAGEYELFGAGEIAWLSADGRFASDPRGVPQSLRLRFYRSDPDARLFGRLQVTEAAVGDVTGLSSPLAARSVAGRGGMITNRPLNQSSQFNKTDLTGDAPVGWDVELYRNGELSGLIKVGSDGRYAFREVPLVYGSNRLEVVKYGPQGQVRRERREYEVGRSAVPPGEAWWWAHAVDENRDLFGFAEPRADAGGWRFGLGLDYGLGLRTSAALSFHSVLREGRRLRLFETELRRSLGPFAVALGGALDTRGGKAVSVNGLGRLWGASFSLRHLHNQCLQSEVIDADLRDESQIVADRSVKIGGLMLPLRFDLARTLHATGRRQISAGARMALNVRRVSVTLSTALQRVAPPGGAYGPVEGTASLLLSARLRGVMLRGEAGFNLGARARLADSRIGAEWSLSPKDSWQATAGYDWTQRDYQLSAAYSRHFNRFTLSTTLSGSGQGGASGRIGLLFSVGPDGRGRFGRMTSARIASTAAVAVNVLRDGGEDDQAQPDDALTGSVRLKVGGQPARNASVWAEGQPIVLAALAPAAPVLIGVDPASLDDPLLDPAVREVRVVPRKGIVLPLDLRVAATGVIEGRLTRPDGTEAAGEAISLIDGAGHAVANVVTDFDGSFLFEKVHYGRYVLARGTPAGLQPLPIGGGPLVINAKSPTRRLPAMVIPAEQSGARQVASQ